MTARPWVGSALLGSAVLAATLAPTTAAAASTPASTLYLTVQEGQEGSAPARSVMLTCDPAGGNHPNPVLACQELAAADGNFSAVHQPGSACTMIYSPVTVHAEGTWRDRNVRFDATYPNACERQSYTGTVFQF